RGLARDDELEHGDAIRRNRRGDAWIEVEEPVVARDRAGAVLAHGNHRRVAIDERAVAELSVLAAPPRENAAVAAQSDRMRIAGGNGHASVGRGDGRRSRMVRAGSPAQVEEVD